jgi:SPP1 gp7 family putative phage head morphogenesis protein
MWTINERMLNDMILRRRWLVNVENDAARRIAIILRELEQELAGRIVTYLGSEDPATWLTAARQSRILGDLQSSINDLFPRLQRDVESMVRDVAGVEADALAARLGDALAQLPENLPIFRVPENMLLKVVTNYLPRNASKGVLPMVERLDRLAPQTGQRVARAFQTAVARGDGSAKIAAEVRKIIGPNSITAHEAAALARTQMQRVAGDVARDFYHRNADVVGTVIDVAALDKRTCLQCAALDGKTYANGTEPPSPFHMQCRCFYAPGVKSWRQLGIRKDQATPEIRRLFDGKPPERQTYTDWLKGQDDGVQKQILGASRFDAYSAGKAGVADFATDRRILTVNEWRVRSAA